MFSTGQESPTSQYLEPNNQIDKMQHELLRLSTFNYFPANLSVSATQLSRAGFYYIGEQDIVQCFSCHLRVKDWSPDSDPVAVHMQYSYGQCPYLNSEFGKRLCGSHLRFSSFDIGMHRDTNKKQLSKNDIISLKSQNLNGEKMNYSRYAEGVTFPLSTSQDYYNSEFGSDEIVTSACSPSPQLGAESTSYNNDVYSNEQAHNVSSFFLESSESICTYKYDVHTCINVHTCISIYIYILYAYTSTQPIHIAKCVFCVCALTYALGVLVWVSFLSGRIIIPKNHGPIL